MSSIQDIETFNLSDWMFPAEILEILVDFSP